VNGKKLLDQELERYREKAMRYKEKFLETSYLKDGSRIANFTTINKDRLREALISYQTDEKKIFCCSIDEVISKIETGNFDFTLYNDEKENNKFRKQLPGESDEKYAENKLLQKQIKEYIGWFIDRGKFHINYDGN
jgi:hypothetical protein